MAATFCKAQSPHLNTNHRAYEYADRLWHLSEQKLYNNISTRKMQLHEMADRLDTLSYDFSSIDLFDKDFFLKEAGISNAADASERGFWSHFYKNPAYLYSYDSKDFSFHINGFFNFQSGHEQKEGGFTFLNKRGIELWGSLDDRFEFYTSFHENQSNFLNYIENFIDRYNTIPRQGHYKPYSSSVSESLNGYDYANAIAFLSYKTSKHTKLELGHGRHFIGNGIRSLLLSDFSHNYLYLNFTVDVWKLKYQSMVAELSPISSLETVGNTVLPKKYMATHYLSLDITPRFEIGLFESVIFSREDQFEFHYLNPVILYRTVEALIDSPDNVLLGLNMNWLMAKRTSVYGQLLIDELRTSEIFGSNKWWGNKWAYQLGIKHFDLLGVTGLDLQAEYNKVRPYTYSHNSNLTGFTNRGLSSYSHFNQALAHPLGANFSELILRMKYRPADRIFINTQFLYSKVGRNAEDLNYGNDILINNNSRVSDFGIDHLQGNKSTIQSFSSQLSYMFFHDFSLDLLLTLRKESSDSGDAVETAYLGLGLRYNIENRTIDY